MTIAAAVKKAVLLIEAEFFDAAMLDMNLGGEDSIKVAEALSARGVPFFCSTGNDRCDIKADFCDRPVLHKPFIDADLSAVLAQLLS